MYGKDNNGNFELVVKDLPRQDNENILGLTVIAVDWKNKKITIGPWPPVKRRL